MTVGEIIQTAQALGLFAFAGAIFKWCIGIEKRMTVVETKLEK